MTTKLKPCPHCDGAAAKYREMELHKVICTNALCIAHEGRGYDTEQEAVDAWNRRPVQPQPWCGYGTPPPFNIPILVTGCYDGKYQVIDGVYFRQGMVDALGDVVNEPHFETWDGLLFREGEIVAWRHLPSPFVPPTIDTPE